MILVDTSVWIEHLRSGNEILSALLGGGEVLGHPFVVGELALGNLRQRDDILRALRRLPQATSASHREVSTSSIAKRCSGAASATSTPICWRPPG